MKALAEYGDPCSVSGAACKLRHPGICKILERFVRFMNGEYDSLVDNIELSHYDIRKVAPQFIGLAKSKLLNYTGSRDG